MISIEQAQARILSGVTPGPSELVPLPEARGRTLSETVHSHLAIPRWDNSAMDGYAMRAADSAQGDVTLRLVGVFGAGAVADKPVNRGEAMGITTGAPMPEGADAVVMVERTDGARTGHVRVSGRVGVGDHIRRAGEDIASGAPVLFAGERVTPGRLGVAASIGLTHLAVRVRPRIAVLATGNEVVAPGAPLGPGQLWSSNQVALSAAIEEQGGIAVDGGIAPDDLETTVEMLGKCMAYADAVITTGGVSVGAYDVVKEAFAAVGATMDFWRVDMKPGKPLAVGRAGHTVLLGLPGNPVSALVNFHVFVRPWIRSWLGDPNPFHGRVTAVADAPIVDVVGRVKLVRVTLSVDASGTIRARPTGSQSSGAATSMARAHGLAILPGECGGVAMGERVEVLLLDATGFDRNAPG